MKMVDCFKRRLRSRPFVQGLRRKLLQIVAFGFTNSEIGNFAAGTIYKGDWKKFCAPGMNCYSCPAARLSCPIGALQAVNGSNDFSFSFYIVGLILAFGVLFGRFLCGFLCPFGLLQELLHRIPSSKFHLPKLFTRVKYVLLAVFVFILPVFVTNLVGMGEPAFCQYICPVGTLEGGIPLLAANQGLRQMAGPLFWCKLALMIGTVIGCVFIYRFFCKLACPLGALLGLLNKISAYHLEVDESECVRCGQCARACKMDVDPCRNPDSAECIRCGHCGAVCPKKAIHFRFGYRNRKGEIIRASEEKKNA